MIFIKKRCMKSFGQIKSNFESALVKHYGNDSFKSLIKNFKTVVLESKNLSQVFYLYDQLLTKKSLSEDVASEYLNESFTTLKHLIEKSKQEIESLQTWVETLVEGDVDNSYHHIDTVVYSNSVTKIQEVVEAKLNIKKIITSKEIQTVTESLNLPLSSMLKIATNTFNNEYSNLEEDDKSKLKYLFSLNKTQLVEEFEKTKEEVLTKLNESLKDNEDSELRVTIEQTIGKINESEVELVSLYKLTQLKENL